MPLTLTKRLDLVTPMTPAQADANWQAIMDQFNALQTAVGVALNADGTIKANAINNINNFTAGVLALLSPVGTIISTVHPTLGTNAGVDGFIYADGSAVSRSGLFLALFTLIGTAYGVGNGTTTFNLPDLRDRVLMCTSPGGLSAGRDTARVLASEVASPAGSEKVGLVEAEMPPHTHNITGKGYLANQNESPVLVLIDDDYNTVSSTKATASAGGTAGVVVPHENLPPVAVIRMLIKL